MTAVTVCSDLELKRIKSVTAPIHTHQNITLNHKIEGNLAICNMNEILCHHASEIH